MQKHYASWPTSIRRSWRRAAMMVGILLLTFSSVHAQDTLNLPFEEHFDNFTNTSFGDTSVWAGTGWNFKAAYFGGVGVPALGNAVFDGTRSATLSESYSLDTAILFTGIIPELLGGNGLYVDFKSYGVGTLHIGLMNANGDISSLRELIFPQRDDQWENETYGEIWISSSMLQSGDARLAFFSYRDSATDGNNSIYLDDIYIDANFPSISLPYFQNFDSQNTGSEITFWKSTSYTSGAPSVYVIPDSKAVSSPNSLFLGSNTGVIDTNYLISPTIPELQNGEGLFVKFKERKGFINHIGGLQVGVINEERDLSSFRPLKSSTTRFWYSYSSTEEFELYITPDMLQTGDSRLIFWFPSSTSANYYFIDNLSLESLPSCAPANNVNITNWKTKFYTENPSYSTNSVINPAYKDSIPTNTTMNVTWTSEMIPEYFIVEYDTVGFTLGTGDTVWVRPMTGHHDTTSVTLTGLNGATEYEVYVRSLCEDASIQSKSTATDQFFTAPDPYYEISGAFELSMFNEWGGGWPNGGISIIKGTDTVTYELVDYSDDWSGGMDTTITIPALQPGDTVTVAALDSWNWVWDYYKFSISQNGQDIISKYSCEAIGYSSEDEDGFLPYFQIYSPTAPASGPTVNDAGCLECESLSVGDFFVHDGDSIEVVDRTRLLEIIAAEGDLTKVCVSHVTDMKNLFASENWFNQDISSWDVSNVTTMRGMFKNADTFNQDISNWAVDSVKDMTEMFARNDAFNQSLNGWNVSSVEYFSRMFKKATSFNSALDQWRVYSASRMAGMFDSAVAFNQDLSGWCVSQFDYYNIPAAFGTNSALTANQYPVWGSCFNSYDNVVSLATGVVLDSSGCLDCSALNVGDYFTWFGDTLLVVDRTMLDSLVDLRADLTKVCVSHITDMTDALRGETWFDQDISMWDVSNVTLMTNMFYKAFFFDQNIGNWDVSNVTNMSRMFQRAMSFDQDLSGWDVSNVTRMNGTFRSAVQFNQDISSWDVSQVFTMEDMFRRATKFDQDLSGWCVPLIASRPSGFETNSMMAATDLPVWGTCPTGGSAFVAGQDMDGAGEASFENVNALGVELYPNPTNGVIELFPVLEGSFTLYNGQGQVLESGAIRGQYDLSGLPNGMYMLHVETARGSEFLRVVKH